MTVYVALLRAVNVGGRFVKMAELTALFAELGFADARTHVQSGNVVFDGGKAERAAIARRIEKGIADRFGFRSEAILRTGAELTKLIAKNPFLDMAASDPAHLVVVFLAGPPTAGDKAMLKAEWDGPEQWRLIGSDLFITYPLGIGPSKLKFKLKTVGTMRNWNIVNAVSAMLAE